LERRGRKKVRIGRMAKDCRRKEGRKCGCKRTKGKEKRGCTFRTKKSYFPRVQALPDGRWRETNEY